MSIVIALCGANETNRAVFSARLEQYAESFQSFPTPERLSAALGAFLPDIVFLRAELGCERLAACAAAIRAVAPDCALILVSDSDTGALASYSFHADDFLLAPVPQKALDDALERVIRTRPWVFRTLSPGTKKPVLRLRDILFIESKDHDCLVCSADGSFTRFRCNLDHLEREVVDCGFLRCHRSYLVNLRRVRALKPGAFELGGVTVPIARACLPLAEEAYRRHALRGRFPGGVLF